ncbi:MAG: cysteine desulfurase [Deltaproteobacteria bacterium]|jgi:cysteine desulfurase|nr:cysteine desulfurase [Deltaproteobacteria bacterium]
MKNIVYADNAATTPLSDHALSSMLPFFQERYGNPSAVHELGRDAHSEVEIARRAVGAAIGANINEIYFNSGGTESDNQAIVGACEHKAAKGGHIVSTEVEHAAVINTLRHLESKGHEVTLLKPDKHGSVGPEGLRAAMRPDTVLVSIMHANNVVGTILPIAELCKVAHEGGALFHTDAVQSVPSIPVNVRELKVDLLSISSHKFHGPKGAGALFVRYGTNLPPLIFGGGQEKGYRSGTENVPGIVGMAAALTEAKGKMGENSKRLAAWRDRIIEATLRIRGSALTGDPVKRLPGLASFVFEGVRESVLIVNRLSDLGICVSSGSACSASSQEAPHVLSAMGVEPALARASLRVSLSAQNTEADVEAIIEALPKVIDSLRADRNTLYGLPMG